jgi:dihydrolipoamide dehydrogenase
VDLAILGAGPGGYVAAIRAAQLGMKVAVVERDALGGICGNWGCIPTKALLRTAEVMELAAHAGELGLTIPSAAPDFEKTIARSRAIADKNAKGVEFLFKKNKIETIRGTGKLVKAGGRVALAVDGKALPAPHVIVATGARPKPLPGIEHDGRAVISYKEAMALPTRPARLVIIGAGAIGVEFAYFYHTLGTKVTLLEALPQILPVEDEEIAAALRRRFERSGIEVLTGVKVESLDKGPPVRVAAVDAKGARRSFEADLCLLAVGVRGNVEGIGLEDCGVKVERGFIAVEPGSYRTSVENVYAIGDVIGPPMLAHKASAEGTACVERLAGATVHPVDYGAIPGCTYCRPEVASVGLTEKRAREAGLKFKVGRFPFSASGKARTASETDGLVKVLVGEPHGELLGAHVLGGAATDMIATLTLAKSAELTDQELLSTVFPHPTFSEALKEAIADAHGEAIDL